ncbi:MAG: hypothetical protein IJB78_00205 [Oscillospiraceae bacterium]|nr:hypothetical protein [Oscillospiraceae bacterium]
MADYKSIIAGTLNSLASKVKEVAESGSVRDIYDRGAGRAKAYARIAKLSLELNGENEELKKVYAEIGRLYYEQSKDAPEGFFAPLFAQAEELYAGISARQDEINSLRAEMEAEGSLDDIDVEISEFEEIVSAAEQEIEPAQYENTEE